MNYRFAGLMLILMIASSTSWWDTSWEHYRKCTINTTAAIAMQGYKAHCEIDTAALIAAGKMQPQCQDLRVINSTNDGVLPYEIENNTCNTGSTVVWFKMQRTTPNANDTIYLYYNNSAAADAQNATAVWNDVYSSVWHLSGNAADSLGNNDLSPTGTVTYQSANCKLGQCANISVDSYLLKNSPVSLPVGSSPGSMECWGYATTVSPYYWRYMMQYGSRNELQQRALLTGSAADSNDHTFYGDFYIDNIPLTAPSGYYGKMFYGGFTYNGSLATVYMNSSSASNTFTLDTVNDAVSLGNHGSPDTGEGFARSTEAIIDECRISNISLSTNWIHADYAQTDNVSLEQSNVNTTCGNLDTGSYTLTSNATAPDGENCFNITGNDVSLDCGGYWILGNGPNGIYNDNFNDTNISNCNINSGFLNSISIIANTPGQISDITIINNTLLNTVQLIRLLNTTVKNNNLNNIDIINGNYTIANNIITSYGAWLNSNYLTWDNNTFTFFGNSTQSCILFTSSDATYAILSNSTFINCAASQLNAGIYNENGAGVNTYINDTFINSTLNFRLSWGNFQGTVINSIFKNNSSIHSNSGHAYTPEILDVYNATFEDFGATTISLHTDLGGTTWSGQQFTIYPSSTPASPSTLVPFNNKSLAVTNLNGAYPTIDSLTFSWNQSEIGPFNESNLGIFEYDGITWNNLNSTIDTVQHSTTAKIISEGVISVMEISKPPPAISLPSSLNISNSTTRFVFTEQYADSCVLRANNIDIANITTPADGTYSYTDTSIYNCGDATSFMSWNVTCYNNHYSSSNASTFIHSPVFNFILPTPQNKSNVNVDAPVNISVNTTCIPSAAQITWNGVQMPMACADAICSFYNASRASGIYQYNLSIATNDPDIYYSNHYVFIASGSPPGNVTINITKNYTWPEFETYSQSFFIDWTPWILAILSFAFSWLLSRRLPETLITGAIGCFIAFLITFNFVFIAASIFSMILGLAMKQAIG